MALLLVVVSLLVAGPVAFGQLADREVVAGGTYTELFQVLCFVGGGGASRAAASIGEVFLRVQVLPAAFLVTPDPMRVSVGSLFRLRADIPFNTPARPYQITLLGIGATGAACPSSSETFKLTVRRPVELSVFSPTQILFPGSSNDIEVRIRRRTNFTGPVRLQAVGLPTTFGMSFNPQDTTGNRSTFKVQVPQNTTQCLPPDGCRVEIKGTAPDSVQVESTEVQIVVLATTPTITVTPSSQTINVGDSVAYDIDAMSPIVLKGAQVDKPGVMAEVNPETRKLNVTTNASTPPGTYQLSVFGTVPSENGSGPTITSKPVDLIVERPANGSVSVTVKDEIVKLRPGFQASVPINVLPKGGYIGLVKLVVQKNLPEGITTFFPEDDDTADLDGTETDPETKEVFFDVPREARPTGMMTVQVDSLPNPPAMSDKPVIKYMVAPELQFSFVSPLPDPAPPIDVRGSFDLFANVARLGCQSEFNYEYESVPKDLFNINLPFNQDIRMVKVEADPVAEETPFQLTVRVKADNCQGDSFTINGTVFPPLSIPPLVTATLAPAGQTIQRGQSAVYMLTVNRGNTQGPIAVNVTGLPAGVTASVVPNPITGSTAQVTLNTTSSTPAGTFTFTVTASANGAPIATATAGLVVVASSGSTSPTISFFTPAGGTAGAPVQITGTNFVGVQNVLFNGTGTPFAAISPTQINTSVPGFATTGPITVITSGGMATSSIPFVVSSSPQTPQITSFCPTSGAAGTLVRIMGVNLGGVIGVSMGTPAFGFNPIPFTPFDATRVDVIIPPGTPSGFFRVMTLAGMATSATAFNVTTPNLPEIGGFSPISGPAGTRVQIIGSNLAGATQVTFAGVNASFEPPQQNSVFATVPPGAMTGQIRVTTPAGTATSFSSFAVTSGGPVITDFQPQSGQVGFSVTIAGANLNGTSQVMFNGKPAQIGIVTPNFVQVFVPTGATSGPIRLVTPTGEATSSLPFTVTP